MPEPCSSEPWKGLIPRLLRVEVRFQRGRPQLGGRGWWCFSPPHRPLPNQALRVLGGLFRAMRLPMTQKGSSPEGHWLTHCSTVETEAQEVATLISHTRKRAVYKHRRPALVSSWGKPGEWGSKNAGFRVVLWGPLCFHTAQDLASSLRCLPKTQGPGPSPGHSDPTGLGCGPGNLYGLPHESEAQPGQEPQPNSPEKVPHNSTADRVHPPDRLDPTAWNQVLNSPEGPRGDLGPSPTHCEALCRAKTLFCITSERSLPISPFK